METYAPAPYFALPDAPYPACAVEGCDDDGTQIVRVSGRYFKPELREPVTARICASHRREIEQHWAWLGVTLTAP